MLNFSFRKEVFKEKKLNKIKKKFIFIPLEIKNYLINLKIKILYLKICIILIFIVFLNNLIFLKFHRDQYNSLVNAYDLNLDQKLFFHVKLFCY